MKGPAKQQGKPSYADFEKKPKRKRPGVSKTRREGGPRSGSDEKRKTWVEEGTRGGDGLRLAKGGGETLKELVSGLKLFVEFKGKEKPGKEKGVFIIFRQVI